MVFLWCFILRVARPVVEKNMRANTWVSLAVPELKVRLYKHPFWSDDILERTFDRALSNSRRVFFRADSSKTHIILESPPGSLKDGVVDKTVCLEQHLIAFKPRD